MRTLKCVIVDDEPIARQILENYVANTLHLETIALCENAFEVMKILQEKHVDILFLDINMPKLSGLSLLKTLQQKPNVIITTAYPEYAIEGFELSVIDYLLKPFSIERFLQAVMKVQQKTENSQNQINKKPETKEKSIFVKSDKKIIKLDFNTIYHIEAYGNYIKIFTDNMLLTQQTLSDFITKLPDNFMRIHKSYAINLDYIKSIDGNQITLQNSTKVTIGKSYKKALLKRIE